MIKKLFYLAILTFFMVGCDPQVSKTPLGTHTETRQVSCEHFGFCNHTDTKGRYVFGMSSECEGTQPAKIRVDDYKVIYKSGAQDIQHETHTEELLGVCQ
jgi:hypothetical protein